MKRRGTAVRPWVSVELDGFGSESRVVCIAATNRMDVLDKALIRPGRFDRKVTVQPPTAEGRLQIFKVHTRDKPLNADVDLEKLAYNTSGYTGALIANCVNNACLIAARQKREDLNMSNFFDAVENERLGKVVKMDRGEANDRRLARVHASAAVAIALLLPDAIRLNYCTIVPREQNQNGSVGTKDMAAVLRPNAITRSILSRHTRTCFVPQLAEEEHYGFDDTSLTAAPYTAGRRSRNHLASQSSVYVSTHVGFPPSPSPLCTHVSSPKIAHMLAPMVAQSSAHASTHVTSPSSPSTHVTSQLKLQHRFNQRWK